MAVRAIRWTAVATLLAATCIATTLVVPAGARDSVVLGSRAFAPHGNGFGTVRPHAFFNGGDPSGDVSDIRWSSWGGSNAYGTGRNAIFKPGGGYYAKLAVIKLWAHDLGRCPGSQRRAYRRLSFRVPQRPGGPLPRHWQLWSGAASICIAP